MSFNALVLAGSRGGTDPVATYGGVTDKALIRPLNETMLAHVVGVLRAAGAARIAVSSSSPAVAQHAQELGCEVLQAAGGPSLSTHDGLKHLGAPLLVTTADHALLRPEWILDFIARHPPEADVAVLMARRESIERDAPGTSRTYLRFADGAWSGCNLFYLATERASAAIGLWQGVEADRKRPWRIVRRLGPGLLLRYLLGRLRLSTAIAHLGDVAHVRAAVVECPYGLAAVDVDKPADLDFVRGVLTSMPPSSPAARCD